MFGDIAFHTEGLRLHGCCKTLPSFIILGANCAVTLTYGLACLYSVGLFLCSVSTHLLDISGVQFPTERLCAYLSRSHPRFTA